MKIYISSSWKNQHAVEMLTAKLRESGHDVLSFIENQYGKMEGHNVVENGKLINPEEWIVTEGAQKTFECDTNGATESDLVIYIGPSGTDAWAEVGAAWGAGVPILGLWSEGEQSGLMRKMMDQWCLNYRDLLLAVKLYKK